MPSPLSPNLTEFGPFIIRWYGFLLATGAICAALVSWWEARRRGEEPTHVLNLLFWGLCGGLFGARLYHVLSTSPGASRDFAFYFIENRFTGFQLFGQTLFFPTVLEFWMGGLGILGGIIGGGLAIWAYLIWHQLNPWRWFDIIAPGVLLGQAIGRWGDFFNQEIYGPPTTLPWGITISDVNQRVLPYDDLSLYPVDLLFQPLFLYDSLWSLIGVGLLLWLARRYPRPEGGVVALYLIWHAIGRFALEFLRQDSWLIGAVPAAQVVCVALFGMGCWILYRNLRQNFSENLKS